MIVNIHAAKTHLSKLIGRMEAGEEVIIARAGRPVARLAPLNAGAHADTQEAPGDLPSWMGSLRGQIWTAPDVDEDWAEMVRLMEEGPIFPDENSDG
jgi:prevent-host-death family protein